MLNDHFCVIWVQKSPWNKCLGNANNFFAETKAQSNAFEIFLPGLRVEMYVWALMSLKFRLLRSLNNTRFFKVKVKFDSYLVSAILFSGSS